jgi:hypothetical protein
MVGILAVLILSVDFVVAGSPFLVGPDVPEVTNSWVVQILENANIIFTACVDVVFGGFALVARGVYVIHGGVGIVEDLVYDCSLLEAFVRTEVQQAGSAELVPYLVAEVSPIV